MKTIDMEKPRKSLKESLRTPSLDCLKNAIKESGLVNVDPEKLENEAYRRTTSEVSEEYTVGP